MKKLFAILAALVLTLSLASVALADEITIAVPNDPTNEGRALLLLQENGIIKLKEDASITATKEDIAENPLNIKFVEAEAATLPLTLPDVDYAIINNNFALDAGLNPVEQGLLVESAESPYVNVLSVKAGNEELPETKVLVAALTSQKVVDFINNTYGGSAIATVAEPTDGYDPDVDYEALAGKTITVAGTAVPHVEVLKIAKEILDAKNIILDIKTVTDYVTPNLLVDAGDVFANYFAHQPYQDNFNAENKTNLVTVAGIHVEPMALYGGKQADLKLLGIEAKAE